MNLRITLTLCVLFAATFALWAQDMGDDDDADIPRQRGPTMWEVEKSQVEARRQAAERIIEAWKGPMPEDPLRLVDGMAVVAAGPGWVRISGTPIEMTPAGLRVQGSCITLDDPYRYNSSHGEFLIADFPYVTTNGSQIIFPEHLSGITAKKAGSVASGTNSVPLLQYGKVITPPPPTDDTMARVVFDAQTQLYKEATSLEQNKERAQDGDPAAQLYMARCYLAGRWVEKNLSTAHDFLSNAAKHGNKEAIAELKKQSSPDR